MRVRSTQDTRYKPKPLDDIVCNICKESTPEDDFLLCDGCSRGDHAGCCGNALPSPRFYFCTHCHGDTIRGMIIQELETAEPSALTCSDIGEKVAARRKADVATTVKSVSSDLYRMWKGELGVRDDGQPVLQRYTEDDNILCYYLTPADTSQTIPQTPMPNLSHTTAAVNQQTPSSVPTLEPNVPQKQQRSSPVQSAARHVHAEAQLPVHDTPKAVKRLLRKRLSRAPSPRHPEVAGGTGSDACGQDPHLEGMEQEQEQISLQRCRPRKPDPPEPFPAYRLGTAPVQPKSQSAQPAQADLRNFAQLRNSVESLQPAPVKSPPQVRKAPHSLKHRLCTVSTNTAQDQQQANRGLQDQQQANTDLQASLMPALLQAAKLADAQVRAPIKPPQTCPVQAAETADQLEDESATSPAGTASPAQEFEPVPQLGQSPGGAKSPRQWSEPPGSSHDGDDLMLEDEDADHQPGLFRNAHFRREDGGGCPDPGTVTDSEDRQCMREQGPLTDDSRRGSSPCPEATPQLRNPEAQSDGAPHGFLDSKAKESLQGTRPQQHECFLKQHISSPVEFIGHQEQDEAMSAQPPANEPQLNSAAGLHEMPAQPRADEPQHNSSAGLHGMPAQAVGYTGIEGDLHPACLLQTQHTGSDATTGGFGSVREGSGLADMVEAVPDQPLSASGQHPSAPQALQEGLSGHHVTGCAVTDMQQAPSVTYFMTQAEALHSVAQWMGDRRCVLKCDRGSLLVQHAMCAEALDPSMCHAPVQTSSHMSGAAAALLDHVQDNPDKCKGTGQLPSDTDVDVQPRQVSCSQPAAQRKRKREVETSLASKKQRLCARLRSSLRNISCGLIALWIFSCFSVS